MRPVPILMYHFLGIQSTQEDAPYYVSPSQFSSQLKLLKVAGYNSISLDTLKKGIDQPKLLPKKPIVITFDDGHESFYNIGVELLENYGFSATMFLITNRIGQPGYLTWEQIITLRLRGFEFGSHGTDHCILTKILKNEAEKEIIESKSILEQKLGIKINSYCYRGGHSNDEIKKIVQAAGYFCAVCSNQGLVQHPVDFFALNRKGIRGKDSLLGFSRKISENSKRLDLPTLVKYLFSR